jgi:beta-glucosidase
MRFPEQFLWGAATAAYQIEGGANVDGRGLSIWDTYSHTPGLVANGDTGDVAADHYHRWPEDVALMRELGLRAYRFSIAWPRIQPDGKGLVNQKGLDFYRGLIDALIAAGIEPVPTLYHWDLPQALEDVGGWPNRDTANRFADYAGLVVSQLHDGVGTWLTLNEPWCSAFLGYGIGRHAPGVHDPASGVRAAHHLLLAHGLAVDRIRAAGSARVGVALNLEPMRPATAAPGDVAAAQLADGMQNRLFLDPIFRGAYPADVIEHLRSRMDLGHIRDGDLAVASRPIDVLGVNYYRPTVVAAASAPGPDTTWPGDGAAQTSTVQGPVTAMGWGVDAAGLEEILVRVRDEYGAVPLLVTENGAAYDDVPPLDGVVADPERVDYLDAHLRAVRRAIGAGVDVRGYFVWSLLDNFEWAEGYAKRFGIVYVDFETQRRVPKQSARWYADVIEANALPEPAA